MKMPEVRDALRVIADKIETLLGINAGRVSETLHGFRE